MLTTEKFPKEALSRKERFLAAEVSIKRGDFGCSSFEIGAMLYRVLYRFVEVFDQTYEIASMRALDPQPWRFHVVQPQREGDFHKESSKEQCHENPCRHQPDSIILDKKD